MSVSYNNLWKKLIDRKMSKTELRIQTGMSSATLAKLGKNQEVSIEILLKICDILECNIEDIIQVVNKNRIEEGEITMDQIMFKKLLNEYSLLKTNEKQKLIELYSNEKLEQLGEDFFGTLLSIENDEICKWYIIKALGELKSKKYIKLLTNVLIDKDVSFDHTSLHLIAASSLGKIGTDAFDQILPLIDKKYSIETQKAAVDSLGEIKSEKAIPILIEKLIEGNYQVALWAGLSLGKIGNCAESIINIYDSLSEKIKFIALDSLMMLDNIDAINFVLNQIKLNDNFLNIQIGKPSRAFERFLNHLKSHGFSKEYENFVVKIYE